MTTKTRGIERAPMLKKFDFFIYTEYNMHYRRVDQTNDTKITSALTSVQMVTDFVCEELRVRVTFLFQFSCKVLNKIYSQTKT